MKTIKTVTKTISCLILLQLSSNLALAGAGGSNGTDGAMPFSFPRQASTVNDQGLQRHEILLRDFELARGEVPLKFMECSTFNDSSKDIYECVYILGNGNSKFNILEFPTSSEKGELDSANPNGSSGNSFSIYRRKVISPEFLPGLQSDGNSSGQEPAYLSSHLGIGTIIRTANGLQAKLDVYPNVLWAEFRMRTITFKNQVKQYLIYKTYPVRRTDFYGYGGMRNSDLCYGGNKPTPDGICSVGVIWADEKSKK